ncbi:MAG TPA: HAD hydrolase family protein [Planctomycetota bacterium]|jgi:YrbI family 3-deoxy-D-manno-octulosonate 8-phosphate phosphatase|nr:HAD hydrolase family protein [Planctomycetota bacterium]
MPPLVYDGLIQRLTPVQFAARLKAVKLLILDVDGVMTDAGMYYSEAGDELKKFNTRDGYGIRAAMRAGLILGIITGEKTKIVARRMKKLGIRILHQGIALKLPVLEKVVAENHLTLADVAYLGDDLGDLECLKAVGLPCTVADGLPANRQAAAYITKLKGGEGAVRELIDLILQARV